MAAAQESRARDIALNPALDPASALAKKAPFLSSVGSAMAQTSSNFPPVAEIAGALDCGVLFLCDHASNALPPEYGDLGVSAEQRQRHIAWDIGAADMTARLAEVFGAPAVMTTWSRLLIDPNRGEDDPTLVRRMYDGAIVPGNARIDEDEIERRRARFFRPYRAAIIAKIEAMTATGKAPAIVSIHSFTPTMRGFARPWEIGFLWDLDDRVARPLVASFRAEGVPTGDNEPYDGALEGDTVDEVATARGLPNVLVEARQDLIATKADANRWADLLARHLGPILADPATQGVRFYGSRAHRRHRRS
jgi:predicted N-formylglutamate amidohydrolase